MSAKVQDSYSSRESEDGDRLATGKSNSTILRTTDVSVTYNSEPDSKPLPLKPHHVYVG
jgi:hypothetical protein